jgi:tellurite resistance protein
MISTVQSSYTDEQISAWLRGLLTIAWADGHFDPEEQELIAQLTQEELAPKTDLGDLKPISAADLASILGTEPHLAENFLRSAVMMAIANGVYSKAEAKVVHDFQEALGLDVKALNALEKTLYDPEKHHLEGETETSQGDREAATVDALKPVKEWLDHIEVHDPRLARFLCKMIPSQCPFERDIKLFGHKIVHIPPMCKLNPLYEQLVGLRFRSLSYLADDCGEDVTSYL